MRMAMGAVWRMNIIRVGCMAIILVALNMVSDVFGSSLLSGCNWNAEGYRESWGGPSGVV